MTAYPNAAALIADARLRLDKLGKYHGVVIAEGSDDRKLLGRVIPRYQILPAGGRRRLLEAYEAVGAAEAERILFVADCDYDVPAGTLRGHPNLVLTDNPDVEADLVGLGVVRELVSQLVPAASVGDDELERLTTAVQEQAVELAQAIGRLRHAARVNAIDLKFDGLELIHFRQQATKVVVSEELIRVVRQRSGAFQYTEQDLSHLRELAPTGLKVCNGHDLLQAVAVVLRQDHNVGQDKLKHIEDMTRLACSEPLLADWPVLTRIGAWERQTGRQVTRL